jgi:drug/metabolite transporter (DMT)-like permease
MNSRTKAHLAVIVANLFYGINFSVMKYVTDKLMQPIALNIIRVVGATALFWLMLIWQKGSNKIERKDYFRFFLCALTGVLINQVLFVKGVSLTSTINASLLMLFCPIAVVFIAAFVLKEKITVTKALGLLLGVAGAALLISLKGNVGKSTNMLLGDLFIIINAISYAFYLVWVKPLMKIYNTVTVIRWVFTIAMFIMLPMGLTQVVAIDWSIFSTWDYVAVSFIIIAVTFCAFLFNIYGVKVLGSSVTGAYIYSQPLFAAFIAIVISKDHSNLLLKLIAAILIFIGVYLVSYKNEILSSK